MIEHYIYTKNWKIVANSESPDLWLGTIHKVTVPWYYRYTGWKLIYIDALWELNPSDIFVGKRDFETLSKMRWQIKPSEWIELSEIWWLEEAEKILEEWDTSWNVILKAINSETDNEENQPDNS